MHELRQDNNVYISSKCVRVIKQPIQELRKDNVYIGIKSVRVLANNWHMKYEGMMFIYKYQECAC